MTTVLSAVSSTVTLSSIVVAFISMASSRALPDEVRTRDALICIPRSCASRLFLAQI